MGNMGHTERERERERDEDDLGGRVERTQSRLDRRGSNSTAADSLRRLVAAARACAGACA